MRVAVAGTFGPLHDGHRSLLRTALEFGEDGVIVALTDDDLAEETRHEPRPVPSTAKRRAGIRAAVAELDEWDRDVAVRLLHHRHGIARSDPDLDALVVSPETMTAVPTINEERRDRDLAPLLGLVVPFVEAADGERISSTRMVKGEVDEHGDLA